MQKINEFQYQIHIENIRKRLWCGREFGQASVMVGAGFSRNSEKVSQAIPDFPLWGKLSEKIYDSLYYSRGINKDKNKINSTSGALRLASEYKVEFGRDCLDALLLKSIPDTQYYPGNLHKLLLSLPWSDVFTTNYDTLLERTLPQIHDRKYDVVYNTKDIPSKMRPRIIKLHGSFPSYYPFIITEEDYRTYPIEFAPFVNTVQQSIMENVLCLVGFSGDDPNFLYWSGWVRDNLGENAPKIYLCGLLNLSNSQKKLLESRNVVPIDISPLFPSSEWHDLNVRHSRALEWFLLNLMEGEPPNLLFWPKPIKKNKWKRSEGLPEILPGYGDLVDQGEERPKIQEKLDLKDLKNMYKIWHNKRKEYTGWIITPEKNRNELWRYSQYWIEPILKSIDNLPFPENFFFLYELNWRFEKVLLPLIANLAEKITAVINTSNPFPSLIKVQDAKIKSDMDEYRNLDWNTIGKCWIELVFALARDAREENDEKGFFLWMDKLGKIINQNTEWQSRWFYEKVLFYIVRLDQDKLRTTIKEWPVVDDLPFWEAKRASILYELGDLRKSEEIAEKSLTKIRDRLQSSKEDFTLLSQEG